MTAGIYRFINNRTGEVYVGQSFNVYARRGKHHKELTLGTHHNRGLQEDHDRGDTFTFEILEKMPEASREELEKREIYYIEKFNSFYEGYNQTPGGEFDKYKGRYEYGGDRLPFHKYKPVPKPKLLDTCPECGGELVKRKGQYSSFAGCINYPKCTFSCSLKEVNLKSKKKANSYKSNLPKSSIEWETCRHCGKKINRIATVCPYCNELLQKPKIKIPKVKYNVNPKRPVKTDFEKYCAKKNNYLTRADCDYLADKYDIDISKANTVKKANPIIRNYLTKTNQWDNAMENLYKHDTQITLKNQNTIGEFVRGHCPNCDGKLIRISKYFIQCENYSACHFSCTNTYYENNILGLSPKSDVSYSSKAKTNLNSEQNLPNESTTTKIVNYYSYWNDQVHIEKSSNNEKINKTTANKSKPNKNKKSTKSSSKYKNINYCSNCGIKIDPKDIYCGNCGEKIDKTIIGMQNNTIRQKQLKPKSSHKKNWGEIFATIIVIIIILAFIFSSIIMFSDVEGPISTVAAVIFISVVCFFCYTNIDGN